MFPNDMLVLSVVVDGPGSPAATAGRITDELATSLADQDLALAAAGTPGAVPVEIVVTVLVDEGSTGAGTPFVAARAVAEIRLGRRTVRLESRSVAGIDRETVGDAVVDDILPRVALALAF